jgi:hypothetical protein
MAQDNSEAHSEREKRRHQCLFGNSDGKVRRAETIIFFL